MEHFEIDGQHFVAVSNHLRGFYSNQKSTIFLMDPATSKFSFFQNIDTRGAFGFHHFTVTSVNALNETATAHFLAVANHYDSSTFSYQTASEIYRWDGVKFTLTSLITTNGATGFSSFVMSGTTFLAVSNLRTDESYQTECVLYTFDGFSLTRVQGFPSKGALKVIPFVVDGQQHLLVLNSFDETIASRGSYSVASQGYRWDRFANMFVPLFSYSSYGAVDASVFTTPWGETFLALSAHAQFAGTPKMQLLIWSSTLSSFTSIPTLPPSDIRSFLFFWGGGTESNL